MVEMISEVYLKSAAAPSAALTTGPGMHSLSWLLWPEIGAIDYDVQATAPDQRVHQYCRGVDGQLIFVGKGAWNSALVSRSPRSITSCASGW